MELARLDLPLTRLDAAPAVITASTARVLISCPDASTVVTAAWLSVRLTSSVGVWLRLGPGYSAALAARDVATLSHLLELTDAVIEGAAPPSEADLVRALLTEDPVDFANDAGTLTGAYNRPAPPRPVEVWSVVDGDLVALGQRLRHAGSRETPAGTITLFG
ncbi:MAG: hypothetical protein WA786_10315 [Acidimicrobiales bacterium]